MTLHPHLRALAEKALAYPPMHKAPIDKLRKATPKALATGLPKERVASVEDIVIGETPRPLRLRIYRPDAEPDRALLLFFHGGGFSICSLDTHDDICRQICRRAGVVVASVDYALAPEHPWPAGPDDCFAATRWAAANAARLGADARRLAVCGDSAGGAMAAVVTQRAREEGGPAIAAQALIYPVADHYSTGHASHTERGARENGLSAEEMRWFWDLYLPEAGLADDPRVSPARARSLAGLPAAYVVTAEYDVLRDEGEAYAAALRAAGVPVLQTRYPTMNHGFLNWVGVVEPADEAMDALAAWLRATL